ncbi:MAG: energy transducer TonB [Saprospiraceae bacterium]
MKLNHPLIILLFAILIFSFSACKTRQTNGSKKYQLRVKPSSAQVALLFNPKAGYGPPLQIALPSWNDCTDSKIKSGLSRCTEQKLSDFLNRHFNSPKEALNKNIEGISKIKIRLDKEGNVTSFKNIGILGSGIDTELLRLSKSMPQWIPANINQEQDMAASIELDLFVDLVLR